MEIFTVQTVFIHTQRIINLKSMKEYVIIMITVVYTCLKNILARRKVIKNSIYSLCTFSMPSKKMLSCKNNSGNSYAEKKEKQKVCHICKKEFFMIKIMKTNLKSRKKSETIAIIPENLE